MKDGRFIGKEKIPKEIMVQLEKGEPNQVFTEDKPKVIEKKCLFCGAYAKYPKYVNQQTLYLCEEHVYDSTITIGKIAQKLREKEKINA